MPMRRKSLSTGCSRGRVRFHFKKSQGACDSARIDFLKGMFHRSTGDGKASSTFAFGILEWMDVDEVRKFIDESVKEPQKG